MGSRIVKRLMTHPWSNGLPPNIEEGLTPRSYVLTDVASVVCCASPTMCQAWCLCFDRIDPKEPDMLDAHPSGRSVDAVEIVLRQCQGRRRKERGALSAAV